MLTHYPCRMKFKIVLQAPQCLPLLTCRVAIGNFHWHLRTAFCPGPGMGLYQFCRMPFGLIGAPGSFQRLMDSVLQDLPFATTYIDDVLVFSQTEEQHVHHLQQVFQHLQGTLCGSKCHIGVSSGPHI